MIKTLIVRIVLSKVKGKEEKMNMKYNSWEYVRITFGMNLSLILGAEGSIYM